MSNDEMSNGTSGNNSNMKQHQYYKNVYLKQYGKEEELAKLVSLAPSEDRLNRIKALIAQGVNLNQTSYYDAETPLVAAIRKSLGNNNITLINFLIDSGANVNHQDHNGETALMIATQWSNPAIIQALLDKGASINLQDGLGNTALHYARFLPIARLLVKNAASLTLQNARGQPALEEARDRGRREVVTFLEQVLKLKQNGRNLISLSKLEGNLNPNVTLAASNFLRRNNVNTRRNRKWRRNGNGYVYANTGEPVLNASGTRKKWQPVNVAKKLKNTKNAYFRLLEGGKRRRH